MLDWIRVSEKVPKLTGKDEHGPLSYPVMGWDGRQIQMVQYDGKIFWTYCEGLEVFSTQVAVTHWAPMPEPPNNFGKD